MEKIDNASEKCELLVDQVQQLSERVKQLEGLLEAKTGGPLKGPLFREPPFTPTIPGFTLSPDRKTIACNSRERQRVAKDEASKWQGFLSQQLLSDVSNCFTLRINQFGSKLMVGVAKQNIDPYGGLNTKIGSVMLCFENGSPTYCSVNDIQYINYRICAKCATSTSVNTADGKRCGNCNYSAFRSFSKQYTDYNKGRASDGSIVTVALNVNYSQVNFKLNGESVYTATLPEVDGLCAAIDLCQAGQSVSFT